MSKSKIKKENLIFVIILAMALGTRQLAMNIVTPFVASYAQSLTCGTLVLGGIALGIYSLTQGFFQVPFGNLYDKIGGKIVVLIGLFILILGLILAYVSDNAYIFVLSRALQGSGAITAAGYSWISQTVSEDERADSISLVGTFVGLASAIALGGGPILIRFISVKTLYLCSAIIVIMVFFFVLFFVKEVKIKREKIEKVKVEGKKEYLKKIFKRKSFLSYITVAFTTNYIGIAAFFVIPEYLKMIMGLDSMWKVLTPSIIIAIIVMRISTKFIKKGKQREIVLFAAIALIIASIMLLTRDKNMIVLFIESVFIFSAYTVVTALIPTLINNMVRDEFRGIVNGLTNWFVYIGSFLGATLSGILFSNHIMIALGIILIFAIIIGITSIIMPKENIKVV
ncbi:MAG: MFS transporter [Clostridium sp.]